MSKPHREALAAHPFGRKWIICAARVPMGGWNVWLHPDWVFNNVHVDVDGTSSAHFACKADFKKLTQRAHVRKKEQ